MSRDTINAYPLQWPLGWQRSASRKRAPFGRTSMAKVIDQVYRELARLGAPSWNVVISSNVALRQDGLPRSGQRTPDDPGVAVYFKRVDTRLVLACDRWDLPEHNLRAIVKHIEALRGQERWGVGSIEQAFSGYKAIPAQSSARPWFDVMGLTGPVPLDSAKARYRKLCLKHHPDHGGDPDAWNELQRAWQQAQREVSA